MLSTGHIEPCMRHIYKTPTKMHSDYSKPHFYHDIYCKLYDLSSSSSNS